MCLMWLEAAFSSVRFSSRAVEEVWRSNEQPRVIITEDPSGAAAA